MNPIQAVLILGFIVGAAIYFSRIRSRLLDRVVVLGFVSAGVFMVSFPNTTTWLAHRLGVGRGVDLVIYIGLLTITFVIALCFAKIRELEFKLTIVVREISITRAENSHSSIAPDS